MVSDNAELTLKGLTLTEAYINGSVSAPTQKYDEYSGGAVWVKGSNARLTIQDCTVSNNCAGQ